MFRRRTQDPPTDDTTSIYALLTFSAQSRRLNCLHNAFVNTLLTCFYSYGPSQADVATFKALKSAPNADKYPHAARWYKHIASHESEFATLPGDPSKAYSTYGPESSDLTVNPAKGGDDDDEDVDLFGSDDEEEDPEAVRIREERLAAYRAKKEAKPKTIAKSVVTLDVKPWGKLLLI